jgi:putative heme iron utilization protein
MLEAHPMDHETTRRDFLRGSTLATAGLLAANSAGNAQDAKPTNPPRDTHQPDHGHSPSHDFPRNHAGPGGSLGSPTDRGKLVPGLRSPAEPPVLVETPDLPNNLPWKMVNGAKEFHLHAQPVKRELLPNAFMNHWGYNGSMPGPTIQVTEGDRVRIMLHNELPEATTLHLYGLELPIAMDAEANPRKMTLQLAHELGVPEVEVIRAFPSQRAVELDIARWEQLIRSFEDFGVLRVVVSNGCATVELEGQFGSFSKTGPFFNVQTSNLDMHLRWQELGAVFAVEKPGHLDGVSTLSFQFYDQAGAAGFKVFRGGSRPTRWRTLT